SDAWVLGFSPSLTAGVYVGFDDHRTLGEKEEGARVALPIWLEFMGTVLKAKPAEDFAHSPLLTRPDQVKEILASSAPERLMAPAAVAPAPVASVTPPPQTAGPSETSEPPKQEPATSKPPTNTP